MNSISEEYRVRRGRTEKWKGATGQIAIIIQEKDLEVWKN